jgi:hypothetical protein
VSPADPWGVTSGPPRGSTSGPAYTQRIYPKKEEEERSLAFASERGCGFAKKEGLHEEREKGLQEETSQTRKRSISALTKPLPLEKPPRWKAGDPDPEPTEQEIAELKKLAGNGGETPMPPNDKQADDHLPGPKKQPTIVEMDLKELKIAWAERWRGRIHSALLEGAMAMVVH